MALTCVHCGNYGRPVAQGGTARCVHCGHTSPRLVLPVLVVTGAAGAGKSTVCQALARESAYVALDGDVIAAGAAAVSDGRTDYAAFWRYVLSIAAEIAENGLVPVVCGVGLPGQVLGNAGADDFAGVHFLALTCDDDTLLERIRRRRGARSAIRNTDRHIGINSALRNAVVPAPHSLTVLDTTTSPPAETVRQAVAWADDLT